MRRILILLGTLAFSTGAFAQTPADAIATALAALPENMREETTVITWKSNFTYDTLKKGTNNLVCFDRSGFPGQRAFSIECTSIANLDRVAQNLTLEAEGGGDRDKTRAIFAAAEKNGTRVKPEYGSMWYHLAGDDQASARPHVTVAVPGATTQSTGLAENRDSGGAWLMNAGTSTSHIMIPGR